MGGSQSQEEEEASVNVERNLSGDGSPITVTQDFIKYLGNKLPNEEREGREEGKEEEEAQQDFGVPIMDAETIAAPLGGRGGSYKDATSNDGDNKWRMKYEMEKQKNAVLKEITSKEIDKTVNEVRTTLSRRVPQLVPACEEYKQAVSDCYHSNPDQPLTCIAEVREYIACVRKMQQGEQCPPVAPQSPPDPTPKAQCPYGHTPPKQTGPQPS